MGKLSNKELKELKELKEKSLSVGLTSEEIARFNFLIEKESASEVGEKKLWDLTADSNHVKFYQWMWGVYAPDLYKTACPYYWHFGFSILLIPFIVMFKIGAWLLKPVKKLIKFKSEAKIKRNIQALILKAKNATTDAELYKIYKSSYFIIYKYSSEWNEVYHKIVDGYFAHKDKLSEKKSARQAKIDSIKYGKTGTILAYVIGAIALGLFGWIIYEILHLFTWPEFKKFTFTTFMILSFVALFLILFSSATFVYDKYIVHSWVGKLKPISRVVSFFKIIWTLILMFVDMIKSIYTKSCPTINWK